MNVVNYVGRTALCVGIGMPYWLLDGFVKHTAYTLVGVAATGLSILTLGQFDSINKKINHVKHAKCILPHALNGPLWVVNPPTFHGQQKVLAVIGPGCLSEVIVKPIYEKAESSYETDSFFTKHIISRGAFALAGLVSIITRTADLMLGLIAAAFAILLYLGRSESVNQFAVNHLSSLVVINDICYSLRMVIHPGWKLG